MLLICLFIFDCAGSLLLCRLFSSCGDWGLLFVAVCGLLFSVASLDAENGLSGVWASAVVALGSRAQAQQLWCMGVIALPGAGIKHMSPALADGFLSTKPPGKPLSQFSSVAQSCPTL